MTEEPYRWLEAIGNRREYVREQLKGGSPVFAASLPDGVLLLGVGSGQSKVFELFDRHALAGLGHPADLEKIRQAAIDAAHVEAFTRAPEDVSLRRLVSFGISPQLKLNFEQIYSAPFLVELVMAELGTTREHDLFFRLHFDGTFQMQQGGVMVTASQSEPETAATKWLTEALKDKTNPAETLEILLQAWQRLMGGKPFADDVAGSNWRDGVKGKVVEIGWLARQSARSARYQAKTLADFGLQA